MLMPVYAKSKTISTGLIFAVIMNAILNIFFLWRYVPTHIDRIVMEEGGDETIIVTVIILTYNNIGAFAKLLPSVLEQKEKRNFFEVIIADAGCLARTKEVIKQSFSESTIPQKYLPLCHNPGYAVANNEASKVADDSSRWILLLNDDIILQGKKFIDDMIRLGKERNAGAVGCKILSGSSVHDTLLEAGSIVWNDGSAAGFGRNRTDVDAPEFMFPRPVDYVSGACLMVRKTIFINYGGFDSNRFPNYYEDTDLQMHIHHDLDQEVWYQPLSKALHVEHGTFGVDESTGRISRARSKFEEKWKHALQKHPPNPGIIGDRMKELAYLKASDLRARDLSKARILYIDMEIPNKSSGRGFGRAFDNLSMLSDLGHRVTVVAYNEISDEKCNNRCLDQIRNIGIEVVTSSWQSFEIESRIGFYEVVIVSRAETMKLTYKKLRHLYEKSPFSLIYDCEALGYRREEELLSLYRDHGIIFPSSDFADVDSLDLIVAGEKREELSLLAMADIVVSVSEEEEEIVSHVIPPSRVQTIGTVMGLDDVTRSRFQERRGILFLASFNGNMYYNGDAIWYFLKEIYPLTLNELDSPIPLTIAGRSVPDYLRKFVKANRLDYVVDFVESPREVHHLFEKARIVVAPHLYGAGSQFKISEALSLGVPTVMFQRSAEAFGISPESNISCVANDVMSFKSCILSVHEDPQKWGGIRNNGITFIKHTHNRVVIKQKWSTVIKNSVDMVDKWRPVAQVTTKLCDEGEAMYKKEYPDVKEAIEEKFFESAFHHWKKHGETEGRKYVCYGNNNIVTHGLFNTEMWLPTRPCREGEELYKKEYPDVKEAILAQTLKSAFQHWKELGEAEGRKYYCYVRKQKKPWRFKTVN